MVKLKGLGGYQNFNLSEQHQKPVGVQYCLVG